ncbi:hypothetical protein QUB59_27275 [Microcoleus sp. A2-D5]
MDVGMGDRATQENPTKNQAAATFPLTVDSKISMVCRDRSYPKQTKYRSSDAPTRDNRQDCKSPFNQILERALRPVPQEKMFFVGWAGEPVLVRACNRQYG